MLHLCEQRKRLFLCKRALGLKDEIFNMEWETTRQRPSSRCIVCKLAEENRTTNATLARPGLLHTREQRVDGLAPMKLFLRLQFGRKRQQAANCNRSNPDLQ